MSQPNKIKGLTPEQWQRRCTRKRRYPDEVTARAAGMIALETHKQQQKLGTYRCPYCKGWHLTKQKGFRKNEPITLQKEAA